MSIRFIEKRQKDVHNREMTDRHQAQSYPLRMPPDLKERMVEASKASGRSLHAEIIYRLQLTLDGGVVASNVEYKIDQLEALLRSIESKGALGATK